MGDEIKHKRMSLTSDIVMVDDDTTLWNNVKGVFGVLAMVCLFPFVLAFMLVFRRDELK